MQIFRFGFSDISHYQQSYKIRTRVFLEEQQADPEVERDHEEDSHYYLLILEDKPVATARWRETKEGIKLERFAMLEEYRNQGYGGFLLDVVMADVIGLGKKVYLHAQLRAIDFYKRKGFVTMGDQFSEAGILHYKMFLQPDKFS